MGAYKPILADSWRLYKNSIWFVTYLSHFYKPILSWWRIQSSLRFSFYAFPKNLGRNSQVSLICEHYMIPMRKKSEPHITLVVAFKAKWFRFI